MPLVNPNIYSTTFALKAISMAIVKDILMDKIYYTIVKYLILHKVMLYRKET
jgi:hypothetical protein